MVTTDEATKQAQLYEILEAEGIQREQSTSTLGKVFNTVTQTYKQKAIVIDANDLQRNPGKCVLSLFTPISNSRHAITNKLVSLIASNV